MTKKTILLVDDDADFLSVLTRRCENIGLEVEQTGNLLNAALMTAAIAPDIICVDVQMPTGNCLSFCEALGVDRDVSQAPIVVLTSRNDLQTHQACSHLHAYYVEKTDDYWSTLKPILRRLAAETPDNRQTPRRGVVSSGLPAELVGPFSTAEMTECSRGPGAKQILVADDDDDMVNMLSQRCSALGCSVVGVNNALDAINEIHRLTPDVVILDVNMPSGSGLSICEMMAADERLQNIPIIILTGRSDESTIRRCHDMLAYYVEKCANTWERVDPLVRELLHLEESITSAHRAPTDLSASAPTAEAPCDEGDRPNSLDALFAVLGAGTSEKSEGADVGEQSSFSLDLENIPWVLCIDDDADFSDALKIRLEDHGVAVIRAFNGRDGYRAAFTAPASAILLDFNMPNGQGDYILRRLKENPVTKDIPVVVITGTKDAFLERRMLAMGATAFFMKPLYVGQLIEHLTKYLNVLSASQLSAATDSCASSDFIELSPEGCAKTLIGQAHDH